MLISLTAKLQFLIFSRDNKRPEVTFCYDTAPIDFPVAAVTMDPEDLYSTLLP
jgi:hypothetical protein